MPLRLNASTALLAASAGLLVAVLFFGGGTDSDRLLPIGLAALFAAGGAVVASLSGLVPVPRLDGAGIALLVLLAAFVVWSGLSVEWSIAPDLSWDMFNREVVYLAFGVVGVYAGALVHGSLRVVASGLALALGAVIAWALAGKVIPGLFPDGARFARLRSPVGHWNALALLCAVALVFGLWLATDSSRRRAERVAGAVLCYAAIVAVVLTYSRSGVAIAVLGALAWVLVGGAAFESLVALGLAGAAAAPVLVFAFASSGITGDGQSSATRVHDGALFAPVLLGGAALAGGVALLLLRARSLPERVKRDVVRGALGVAAAAVVVVLVVLVVRAGGPGPWIDARWHDFSSSSNVPNEQSSRFSSFSSNHRWTWWQEAWRSFEHSPAEGRGAGSFPIVNLLERPSASTVTEPHNLLLQSLSDAGVVGFLLLLGAIVAAVLVARGAVRRARGPDRAATLVLALGAGAYLLQALVDIDWDFIATSGPVFFVLGVLASRGVRPASRPAWALAAGIAACVAAASLLFPWLAARRVGDAYAAIDRDPAAAAADARQANSLNPLSVLPLYALAAARALQGRFDDAELAYARAVRLQPDNPDTWYRLGSFELDTRPDPAYGCAFLKRSLELDRFDRGTKQLRARVCR